MIEHLLAQAAGAAEPAGPGVGLTITAGTATAIVTGVVSYLKFKGSAKEKYVSKEHFHEQRKGCSDRFTRVQSDLTEIKNTSNLILSHLLEEKKD